MEITRIEGAYRDTIIKELSSELKKKGYDAFVSPIDRRIRIQDVRLSDEYIRKIGYNVSPYTGRRGNILNWDNWVEVNKTINSVLDRLNASANVSSLHGRFVVREGRKAFTERDWNEFAYENVGSIISPVPRREAWLPENPEKFMEKLKREVL